MCFRQQLVSNKSKASGVEEWVENWTKWRLHLGEDMVTVFPHQQMSMDKMVNSHERLA